MQTTEFYKKTFECGVVKISRYDLETLAEPFCTRGLTDEMMQMFVEEINNRITPRIPQINLPYLFQRKEAKERLITAYIYCVLRENRVPEYLDFPEYDRYDHGMLKIINPTYDFLYHISDEDVRMVNRWVKKIESWLDGKPKVGDIVCYTSKHGDYSSQAMLEKYEDSEFTVCVQPMIPFVQKSEDRYTLDLSGGDFRTITPELLVERGTTRTFFKNWGHAGRCASGTLKFLAQVNKWEYNEPYPLYGKFTTKEYRKYYFMTDYKDSYTGEGLSFKSKQEFKDFTERYNGITFCGNYENQIVLWCYKSQNLELTPDEWDCLELPVIKSQIKGKTYHTKIEKDHQNHFVNYYYVESLYTPI